MSTQIAIPIDAIRKHTLIKNLKNKGLTTKWFIISCIDAFNNWQLQLGIQTAYNTDMFLTEEERRYSNEALEEIKNGDYSDFVTLDDLMKKRWLTR